MERIVFTIIQGAVDFPDPIAQKTCFIILTKLVELWGESETWPRQEVVSCEQEARFLSLPAGQYRVWASLWALLLLQEVKTAWWASPTLSTNTLSQPVSWLPSNRPLTCQMHRRSWWVSLIPPLIKKNIAFWWQASTVFFFSGSVGVRSDTEDDSSQTGKNVFLWLTKLCYVSPRFHLNTCCFCFRDSNSSSSCSRSTCHHSRWPRKFHRSEKHKPWRPKIPRDVFLYLCSVLFISKCFFI